MITNEQALNLYELTQLGDNRKPPIPAQLMLWRKVSERGNWSYEQAVQAIIEFRSDHPGEYFEPGHVSTRVAELRKEIRQRWECPDPPYELADDPMAECQWRRRMCAEFTERNLARWTQGLPLASVGQVFEIEGASPLSSRADFPAVQSGDHPDKVAAVMGMRQFSRKSQVPKPYGMAS
jgi:hypothetical protein